MAGLLEKLGLTRTVTADKSKKKKPAEAISAIKRRKKILEDL